MYPYNFTIEKDILKHLKVFYEFADTDDNFLSFTFVILLCTNILFYICVCMYVCIYVYFMCVICLYVYVLQFLNRLLLKDNEFQSFSLALLPFSFFGLLWLL